MPKELTEQDNARYEITSAITGHVVPESVHAAYVTSEEKMPGWVLLKDHEHRTVALFRQDAVFMIRRTTGSPS